MGLILLVLAGCGKEPEPVLPPGDTGLYEKGVIVVNEGNYTWGNAAVDFFDPTNGTLHREIFTTANGIPLGDVFQSGVIIGDRAYLVVNNSQKVEVVNLSDFKLEATISGMTSPRYLIPVSDTKAYVSDLFAKQIHIVNLVSNTVTGNIPVGAWTEEMVMSNDKVFVCETGSDKVLVLDPNTDQLLDSIAVGKGPNSIVTDAVGRVWVLCDGGFSVETPKLVRIDATADTVVQTLEFSDISMNPSELRINGTGNMLYYLNDGIFRFPAGDTAVAADPWVASGGRVLYGLGLDPENGDLYVSDVIDYVQRGWVYRYSSAGVPTDSFKTGIIPGGFLFAGK